MNIELKEITISELSKDFKDNNENGVVGFGGKLDIRLSGQSILRFRYIHLIGLIFQYLEYV
jgi:hypothetical protein